jgi:putative redox protein
LVESIDSVRGVVTLAAPSDTGHLADRLERMDEAIAKEGRGTVSIGGKSYQLRQEMMADFRRFDLPSELRKVTKPALLFHSPTDETLGFEHAMRLFGLLTQRAGEDSEPAPTSLVCLPAADHLLVENPADLEFVTETIAAWFRRLLAD